MEQSVNWKERIKSIINDYIHWYRADSGTPMSWNAPLVGFAHACAPEFHELKQVVHKEHALPRDVLPDASVVISYFLPFPAVITDSNASISLSPGPEEGRTAAAALDVAGIRLPAASDEWAMAYRETNILFGKLNEHLVSELQTLDQQGRPQSRSKAAPVHAALPLPFASMDGDSLTSRWSQRHVAWIAGLGSFGMNNMLITEAGCAGRCSSIVTNLQTPADPIQSTEACLYKQTKGTASPACGLCLRQCPSGALTENGFDRFLCEKVCDANQAYHDPDIRFGTDSSVCGKCLVRLPCTFRRP